MHSAATIVTTSFVTPAGFRTIGFRTMGFRTMGFRTMGSLAGAQGVENFPETERELRLKS